MSWSTMCCVLPSIEGSALTNCNSFGLLIYIKINNNGVKHIDEPMAIYGSVGPAIPLELESNIEANNMAVNWVMNDSSKTNPSILRTIFQGEDGCQSAKPAGVGLRGMPTLCICMGCNQRIINYLQAN